MIIDAQLHDPAPWTQWPHSPVEIRHQLLTELTLTLLDSVGVDGALVFPIDESWAASAARAFPDRLAYIPQLDPTMADLDRRVAAIARRELPGVIAVRVVAASPLSGERLVMLIEGFYDPLFAACERHAVPVFLFISGKLGLADAVARRFPRLTLIIDHLGLRQPPMDEPTDPPFADLPALLRLAEHPNVAVKFCGAPALSSASYPYPDVWPYLTKIVEAFGPERLMWASDIARFRGRMGFDVRVPRGEASYPGKHTYAESLLCLRETDALDDEAKRWLLGETARTILRWSPRATGEVS